MKKIGKIASGATWALCLTLLAATASAQQPVPRPAPQRAPHAQPAAATQTAAPPAQPVPIPQAQPTQPTPSIQAPSNAPQRTSATYDDWIVQCETQAGPPTRKVCEMTQLTQVQLQGKTQPFSRAVVPRPAKDQPVSLLVQLPVNVSFSPNARVQIGDTDQGVSAPFARCIPDGCFVEFEIREDTLKKFRSATAAGKLSFSDSSGRSISVPLSFNGFGKAYDALLKE